MRSPHRDNFDGLARVYPALEWLAFGGDLMRARLHWLGELHHCRDILVLGEGDGRCLEKLVQLAPHARIHVIDASAAMLARATARIAGQPSAGRVTFEHADILTVQLPTAHFDAVTTLFFLDCFTAGQIAALLPRVQACLRPEARWIFSDFALPTRGYSRWRAQIWLAMLYAFFRWRTGIAARALPPTEALLASAGWQLTAEQKFQHGLLRSAVYRRTRG